MALGRFAVELNTHTHTTQEGMKEGKCPASSSSLRPAAHDWSRQNDSMSSVTTWNWKAFQAAEDELGAQPLTEVITIKCAYNALMFIITSAAADLYGVF